MMTLPCGVDGVLFDFGGVLAEEGFFQGLCAVAEENGRNGMDFFGQVSQAIFESGYLEGRIDEAAFWIALEARVGLPAPVDTIRKNILERFVPRPWMLQIVRLLDASGIRVAILSDQTNWLEELDQRYGFYQFFEQVFNSYRLGLSKYRPETFQRVLAELDLAPERTLFVDDNAGHVQRAAGLGLQTIHFTGRADFMFRMRQICPGLAQEFHA
ncbi:HAD family hydrolase [Desulfonatronum parangueonense]